LDAIFSPRSIAVVGASRNRNSIGFALLHNLVSNQFNGTIFPVNPHAESIHSLKAYPSMDAIPDPVDLAVIMVPKKLVQEVVEQCIDKGVRGLIVISAGFGETDAEGLEMERRLRETVRAANVRMIGPNCMGVINTEPEFSLDATFSPTPARRGSIGFVSQSGALGVAVLNAAADLSIGLTQFVSMGNKADVSGNDLVEYWENDPETRVICMYLESFGNPRHFTEIAKRVSRKKPILIVKSGRTAEGARAASSHTGAIAGADLPVSAFLAQIGVLRANTITELFDTARALDHCPLPADNRVAILTNAGGPAIMATDACVNLDLEIAQLSKATQQALGEFLPAEASVGNPIDMIASATPDDYAKALQVLLADDQVDMVMVINVKPLVGNPIAVMNEVGRTIPGQRKPVVDSALRSRPLDQKIPVFDVDDGAVSELVRSQPTGYLPPDKAFRLLELYGIPVAQWRMVHGAEEVMRAAEEIGFPVVVKAAAEELVHKSDLGGVKVDLRSAEELTEALQEIQGSLLEAGIDSDLFLVQEMAKGGHEVIFGITTDPRFGPLLMFGLGGKYVEVFRDVRFGVTPLTPFEAGEMVRRIQGFKLLEGVRGEAGADLSRLEDILLRMAQLAQRHPGIQELDINPFLAGANEETCKALDVRIRVGL
jgi:acetyl coenzyme A synthetase (ADP forming)-like protein